MLPQSIEYILNRLNANGHTAYIVGGCVRDMLMGREPHDFDITTSAKPAEIMDCFSMHTLILSGLKHGTVTVNLSGELVEITTYRIDGEYTDNRHPEKVIFTDDIEKDLARRDFTMNAIAMDISGNLCDAFAGKDDIKNCIIRCVGDADTRFHEDALRILRALRFASVLTFDIDHNTSLAIHKNKSLLHKISSERIQTELFKLLMGDRPSAILCEYADVFSEFMHMGELTSRLDTLPKDTTMRLAAMLYGTKDYRKDLHFLKVSNAIFAEVAFLIDWASNIPHATRIDLKRLIGIHGIDAVLRLIAFSAFVTEKETESIMSVVKDIEKNKEACSIKDLCINGRELVELGFCGAGVGECLSLLLELVLCGELANENAALLHCAENFALQNGLKKLQYK